MPDVSTRVFALALTLVSCIIPGTVGQCQLARITGTDAADDLVGFTVGAGSSALVIGAPFDDEHGRNSGAVYIADRSVPDSARVLRLTLADGETGDGFGRAVATSAFRILATITRRQQAIVYERNPGGLWVGVGRLDDPEAGENDFFGCSVALHASVAVVGAPHDTIAGDRTGSAYVFERDSNGMWSRATKLRASDAFGADAFGQSVAVSGDVIVVGAPDDDPFGFSSGSAYVFERHANGVWTQAAKLIPADGGGLHIFGWSVAVGRSCVLVGAPNADGRERETGAVYVFEKDSSGAWSQRAKLMASDGSLGDSFGASVAVDDDNAVIGSVGVEPGSAGAGYVFSRVSDGPWTETAKLRPVDVGRDDQFGWSAGISGNLAVFGAPRHDVQIDGDILADAGAAYLFAVGPDRDENGAMDVCECRAAVGGDPGSDGSDGFVASPDLDLDKRVGLGDLVILLNHFGDTGVLHEAGDLDLDRDVDLQDLALLLAAYDKPCE